MASTEGVKDIIGALSVRLGASVIADVSEFEVSADGDGVQLSATRPVMASKAQTKVHASAQHVMVSVRSGSYGILDQNGESQITKPLSHQPVSIEHTDSKLHTQIREDHHSSREYHRFERGRNYCGGRSRGQRRGSQGLDRGIGGGIERRNRGFQSLNRGGSI